MNLTPDNDEEEAERLPSALEANLAYYERSAESYLGRTRDLDFSAEHRQFSQLLPPDSLVLDAGCGSGRDSVALRALGHRIKAIDASPSMVDAATALGVDAEVMSFQEMEWSDTFDGIWAFASLLHVPKNEITDVLLNFWRAAKDRAVLFVSLKEGDGERFIEDGRFFSYFTQLEFSSLLTEDGRWEIVSVERQPSEKTTGWLRFWARARKHPETHRCKS